MMKKNHHFLYLNKQILLLLPQRKRKTDTFVNVSKYPSTCHTKERRGKKKDKKISEQNDDKYKK